MNCRGYCCLTIEGMSVKAGRKVLLEGIDLHVHCREITAVIGPNGAGKSTLLKAIMGMVKYNGTLRFCDEDGKQSQRPSIGYVPQQLEFDRDAPCSVLDLYKACQRARHHQLKRAITLDQALQTLEQVQAAHLIHAQLGRLSGGELQRVMLAMAIDPIPQLLLLDEPATYMDIRGLTLFYKQIEKLIAQYDLSIIVISHDMDFVARYAHKVILLDSRVLDSGTPAEVMQRSAFSTHYSMGKEAQ